MPRARAVLAAVLVAASFVVLFQELALIRWLAGQVRVVAYFPNLILISAFLGLGVGCLRAGRRSLLWLWPVALLLTVTAAALLSRVVFTQEAASEHLFLLYYDLPRDAPVVRDVRPPLLLFFLLSVAAFVPLGQVVAERLQRFGEMGDPLAGYAWDITGSLAGIAAFTAVSFVGLFPVTWFACFLLAGAVFFRRGLPAAAAYLACAGLVVGVVHRAERAERYSPYYALSTSRSEGRPGVKILTNGSLHQYAFPMQRQATLDHPVDTLAREGYHLPYSFLARPPRRALVIGAGTGNDVATLLDEGAERVYAVEIDPAIIEYGRALHPSRPYDSPKVHIVNADARTFLNETRERYDLVVFGTLDSMTRLSALSSVRLDNFVYTQESVRAARRVLTEDGGLVLYFMVGVPYIDMRLGGMLTEAFGEAPLVLERDHVLFNRAYMVGPAFSRDADSRRAAAPAVLGKLRGQTELPSDDWPYLYLERRGVSGFYGGVGASLLVVAIALVLFASPEMRTSVRRGADWEMLLLGIGFLLLETRAVTAMNLVWGATWLTSAVVFLCVLLMVLVATVVVRRWPLSYPLSVLALAVALLVAFLAPVELVLHSGWPARLAASLLAVGTPVFFASMCFSLRFAGREAPDRAFGWNVLGAVAGGLLEMGSMAVGLRALLLIALAAFGGSAWLALRPAQPSPRSASR